MRIIPKFLRKKHDYSHMFTLTALCVCVSCDVYSPTELNVFVDAGCDAHGNDGVVP